MAKWVATKLWAVGWCEEASAGGRSGPGAVRGSRARVQAAAVNLFVLGKWVEGEEMLGPSKRAGAGPGSGFFFCR